MTTPQQLRDRRDSLLSSVNGRMTPLDRLRISVEVQEINERLEEMHG